MAAPTTSSPAELSQTATKSQTSTPRRGFDSLEVETHVDALPVDGQLPPWLTGSLLRTGPAKWEVGAQREPQLGGKPARRVLHGGSLLPSFRTPRRQGAGSRTQCQGSGDGIDNPPRPAAGAVGNGSASRASQRQRGD